jgi:hypothetical protein
MLGLVSARVGAKVGILTCRSADKSFLLSSDSFFSCVNKCRLVNLIAKVQIDLIARYNRPCKIVVPTKKNKPSLVYRKL